MAIDPTYSRRVERRDIARGLAASAVTALAVTGLVLPAEPASAAGEGVLLISPFNQGFDVSTQEDAPFDPVNPPDGVELTALRLDPAATISFQYNTDPAAGDATGGWTDIPGASMTGDFASVSWAPNVALVGTSIAVRAVSTGGASGTTYSTRNGVAVTDTAEAVTIAADPVGFFVQPYADSGRTGVHAAVPGTTSATSGTVELSWWRPSDMTFQGKVNAEIEQVAFKTIPTTTLGGAFSGDLDLSAFGADDGDVIALGAERDTDDLEPVTLQAQTIDEITAASVPVPAGRPADVELTVEDASNRPVVGAEVRRQGGALVGYTDGAGVVHAVQTGGQDETYYVNTTDADAFEAAIDKTVTYDAATYVQVATTVTAVSTDGPAFDDDEYAAGDLYLRVDDQNGAYMDAGTDVHYRLYPTGSAPPAAYATAPTDAQGRVTVPFAPAGPDGSHTLDYHLGSDPDETFVFTAGDAVLSLAPSAGVTGAGGQISYTGGLTVAGQPLPGRRVGLDYTRGIELVPGLTPDAGLGAGRTLSLVVTTDASGAFVFVVDDADESPQGAETGGRIAAGTLAPAGGAGTLTGNAAETAQGTAQFGSAKGKVKIKLTGKGAGTKVDKLVVKAPTSVSGEKVKIYRVLPGGKLELVTTKTLDRKGDLHLKVADDNAGAETTYLAKLQSSERVKKAKSKKVALE